MTHETYMNRRQMEHVKQAKTLLETAQNNYVQTGGLVRFDIYQIRALLRALEAPEPVWPRKINIRHPDERGNMVDVPSSPVYADRGFRQLDVTDDAGPLLRIYMYPDLDLQFRRWHFRSGIAAVQELDRIVWAK